MLDAYPDWTIPASVIAIVPTANREKATVKVRIRFEKKDPRILPDMAVKVNFLADAKKRQGKGRHRDHRRELAPAGILKGDKRDSRTTDGSPYRRSEAFHQGQGNDLDLRSSRSRDSPRRFHRRHGAVRFGQDDAAQPARRHRPRRRRRDRGCGPAHRRSLRGRARRLAGGQYRLHLPVLQSDADADRGAERRTAAAAHQVEPQGARRARSDRAFRGRARRPHQAPSARNVGRTAAARGDCARHRLGSEPAAVRRTDRRSRPRNPPTRSCRSCNCSMANSARPS